MAYHTVIPITKLANPQIGLISEPHFCWVKNIILHWQPYTPKNELAVNLKLDFGVGELLVFSNFWGHSNGRFWYNYSLRIQVCPKKGITPTFLFFSDGIGTLNPIRSGGVWILRDYLEPHLPRYSECSLLPDMDHFTHERSKFPGSANFVPPA